MVDKKQLEEVYKQNLENDIINAVSEMKGLDLRKAFDIYYSSKLAEQISNDSYGIENMDAKYLAEDLIENEPELFKQHMLRNISMLNGINCCNRNSQTHDSY